MVMEQIYSQKPSYIKKGSEMMEIKINSQKLPKKDEALKLQSMEIGQDTLVYWEIFNVKTNESYVEDDTKNIINLAKSANNMNLEQKKQQVQMLLSNTKLQQENSNLKQQQINLLLQVTKMQKENQ